MMTRPTKSHPLSILLAPLTALALCVGCDGDGGDDEGGSAGTDTSDTSDSGSSGGPPPSFAETVKPIVDATCVTGCHEPGGIWELLDLSIDPYDELVGAPAGPPVQGMNRVEPGDSDNSYTYHKLVGTHESVPGAVGTRRMPLDPATCTLENFTDPECLEAPLSDADIQTFKAWIDGGAEP